MTNTNYFPTAKELMKKYADVLNNETVTAISNWYKFIEREEDSGSCGVCAQKHLLSAVRKYHRHK